MSVKQKKNDGYSRTHHEGHRKRVRERYKSEGLNSFTECEILELILFYTEPRKDTQLLATKLLDEFGSISELLKASDKELEAAGASESFKFFLRFFNDVDVFVKKQIKQKDLFKGTADIGPYMCAEAGNLKNEHAYALLVDNDFNIAGDLCIGRGFNGSADFDFASLIERCVETGASMVAVAHNHPGTLKPSTEDFLVTQKLQEVLAHAGIHLIEHYIVNGSEYIGIKELYKPG